MSWYPWPEWPKDKEGGYTGEEETECSTCGKRMRMYTMSNETGVPGPGMQYAGLTDGFGTIGIYSWGRIFANAETAGHEKAPYQKTRQVCEACSKVANQTKHVANARHVANYRRKLRKDTLAKNKKKNKKNNKKESHDFS